MKRDRDGAVLDVAAQLADLIDAAVAGAVDLDDVDVFAGGDHLAVDALVAGLGGRPADAVERLGEDASGGGLADAAGAGEQVGVGDAIGLEGVDQRPGHRLLADEVAEALRAVTAGQDGVAFRGGGLGGSGLLGHDLRVSSIFPFSIRIEYFAILQNTQ